MIYDEKFTLTLRHTKIMDYDGAEQFLEEPVSACMVVDPDNIYAKGKDIEEVKSEILYKLIDLLIEKLRPTCICEVIKTAIREKDSF